MQPINPSDPAFPIVLNSPARTGMTIRTYIASQALQGLLANRGTKPDNDPTNASELALLYADALLLALSSD